MKCEICGQEAPFFIESYLPQSDTPITYRFCRLHMEWVNIHIHRTIEDLRPKTCIVEEVKG